MELRTYLGLLRRLWWLPIVISILLAGIAYFVTPTPSPVYVATSTVLLSQGGNIPLTATDVQRGERLSATYGELMRAQPLMQQVIINLGLNIGPEQLARKINVTNVIDTSLLEIAVTDSDPQRAADIANEVVRLFIQQNEEIQSNRYKTEREEYSNAINTALQNIQTVQTSLDQLQVETDRMQVRINALNSLELTVGLTSAQITERSTLETEVSQKIAERNRLEIELERYQSEHESALKSLESVRLLEAQTRDFMSVIEVANPGLRATAQPRKIINAVQAAIGGVILAAGFIAVLEFMRVTVKSSEEIERLVNLPTLGIIANIKGQKPPDKLVTIKMPRSPAAEAYRILRTTIDFTNENVPIRTLLVTSSSPVEGKTTTAANLAIAIAQSGKKVILVDTDLRRPSVHKLFQQPNTRGVTTALVEGNHQRIGDHLIPTSVPNLYLLPSGPLPPNPADLLGSRQMSELFENLCNEADLVIFDSPPLLAAADATLLARMVDGVLLVVLAESTRMDTLKKAKNVVTQSGGKMLGVVLNRVSASSEGYYYGYYYYSSTEH